MLEPDASRLGAGHLSVRSLAVGGPGRRYACYLPNKPSATPPVLLVLHGYGGSADDARLYGLEPLADREGFVLAYAEAPAGEWNVGHQYRNADPGVQDRDDVGYLDALISDLPHALPCVPGRVGLVGVSMGGLMAVSAAAAMPQRVAGIAAVISGMTNRQPQACGPAAALPYLLVIGEDDRLLPPDHGPEHAVAGQDGQPLWLLPYDETLAHWADWNICEGERHTTVEVGSHLGRPGQYTRHAWHRAGLEWVVGCRVAAMGHRWPGQRQHPRERSDPSLTGRLGPPAAWPEGAELVWRFLERHLVGH